MVSGWIKIVASSIRMFINKIFKMNFYFSVLEDWTHMICGLQGEYNRNMFSGTYNRYNYLS